MNDEFRMTNDERMTRHENPGASDDSFWADEHTPFVPEEPNAQRVYDLEERTARFGEAVIAFAKEIPVIPLIERIIGQLVGAGTSVGANYDEANNAVCKKEFLKCIGTCKKEARESKHFLGMAARVVPDMKSEARELWLEAMALRLIFSKIWRTGKKNKRARMMAAKGIPYSTARTTARQPRIVGHLSFIRHPSFVIRHSNDAH